MLGLELRDFRSFEPDVTYTWKLKLMTSTEHIYIYICIAQETDYSNHFVLLNLFQRVITSQASRQVSDDVIVTPHRNYLAGLDIRTSIET